MAKFAQRLGLTRYEADEYYKKALEAFNNKNMSEAILSLEKAIELLPGNAEYYAARGFFYLEDGAEKEAAQDFEKALQIHPYETLAHYGRGMLAYQSRNWDEALAHFTDAYRADPERRETIFYLALVYHHQGENQQALALLQRAEELFDAANDRRKADVTRWLRQVEKQVKSA